jgi:hypothetical protein
VPWQSGHYYVFSKLLIDAVVPAESGVFALYSCHEQVFIGESANIQKALRALHTNMMRFGFNRSTGFTFELCPDGSRLKRLKELLTEHEIICDEQPSNNVLYG